MPRTSSEALLRPDLGCLAFEYSMSAASQGFIGRQVLPPFSTALQSSVYPVIEAGTFLELAETERAARAAYARGDWQFGDDHYFCKENGWEEPVDDQEAALFKNYFDAEVVAVKRATLMVLRSQERRVAHKVMDTAKITNAPVAKAWNDYANADPLADVVKAKEVFRYTVGLKPNALVLDEDILKHVSMCSAVMERVKYTSPNAIRGELTIEQLKAYFGVDNILVAGAVYNNAPRNKDKKIETVWPLDKVLLACISSGGQDLKEPALGRTFVWEEDAPGELVTEQYREEQTRGDIYRVRQNTDECLQFPGAGYILTGVTTGHSANDGFDLP